MYAMNAAQSRITSHNHAKYWDLITKNTSKKQHGSTNDSSDPTALERLGGMRGNHARCLCGGH